MPDNTDAEPIDNPTSNQLEDRSDEIIPAIDTEVTNPKRETENMEVHHHAHHEGKKKLEILWLGIFDAFFCCLLRFFSTKLFRASA